jgi:hypothetical protein
VYRSCASENDHGRPEYYSKRTALLSFLRAAGESGVANDVVFLNDGPIPADRLELMERAGRVVNSDGLGVKGSYRRAVAMAASRTWKPDDLVYLVEDDYLWRPDSLRHIVEASASLSPRAYLTSYGTPFDDAPTAGARVVGERTWVPVDSCCSTIAARRRVWTRDRWIHWIAPLARGNWDRTINVTSRGDAPFEWRQVARDAVSGPYTPRRMKALVPRVGARATLCLAALVRRRRPRQLYLPVPDEATHLMLPPMLAEGTDWAAIAREAERWAANA